MQRMNHAGPRTVKAIRSGALATVCASLFLCSVLHAQGPCSAEIKVLLAPSAIKTAIPSLGFEKQKEGRVYFFDTDKLALLHQGVIVRIRQGGNDDLAVKVRLPEGSRQVEDSRLREEFPCEIDRTGAGADTTYSAGRKYKPDQVPQAGAEILSVLSLQQKKLLEEAHVSIDWSQVRRIADIDSTAWESTVQPPFRKLALEQWEWAKGSILELSAKTGPDDAGPKLAELQRLAAVHGLALNASQGTKTTTVLETMVHETSR